MHFLNTLLAPLVLLSPLTAYAATVDRFSNSLSQSYPVRLDDAKFSALTAAPRDYAVVVLLTAMERKFGCQACHDFQPEWDTLSRSWQRGDRKGASRVVFATLDFVDGKDSFVALGLQHAPVVMLYPPTSGLNAKASAAPVRYEFSSSPSASGVHSWVARQLPEGPHPPIIRPFNYVKLILTTVGVLGTVTVVAVLGPYVMPILQNRNIWAAVSLLAVLLFTSGHMFNRIRNVPYVAGDGKGGVSYFAGGFQNQFGMETQIIAAIYGILAFAAINLALKCPRIPDDKTQTVAILAWGGILFLVYSLLLNVFRFKNGGYPFYLPPF